MPRDIPALVAALTLDEKASLTAGASMWATTAVPRLGIGSVWLTDGPNGARGPGLPGADDASRSACMPCGTALGASWDPSLAQRVGAVIGEQARTKGCRVLLGPTVNLHRSPLGGRNFESYSEDPLLTGRIAAAFVRGAQAQGVVCTVKHYVGNESEHDRMIANSCIDERTLHENYLLPFELAVREGGALGIMSAYNLVNGTYTADHRGLLHDVLRELWGFDGFVVTDWFAALDTAAAAHAGLDLEMPGPARAYGPALATAVRDARVPEAHLDAIVTRLLRVFDRIGALDDAPERVVESADRPEHRQVAYDAACAGTVLLRNDGLLPLDRATVRTLAVIGPNAARAQIMGGGSAQLTPHYVVTPLEAFAAAFGPEVTIVHEPGVDIARRTPAIDPAWLTRADGSPGVDLAFHGAGDPAREVVDRQHRPDTALWFFGPPSTAAGARFALTATARVTPDRDATVALALVQSGRARVFVDDVLVLDGATDPMPPGRELYGVASEERTVELVVAVDRPFDLRIEVTNPTARALAGCKVGLRLATPPDLLERAVAAARAADAVVVVAGTDDDWESEGHDRAAMRLPGRQDELIAAALAANPRTVVVLNAGSPNELPWIGSAPAVLQCWFGGQEMSHALADMVLGHAEPGGRLPTTFPRRLEHNPSHGNFPAENGTIRYGEGLLVGYRGYEARDIDPLFAFGHGLGYTRWQIDSPAVSSTAIPAGETVRVDVPITNVGDRAGSEVVQCYVAPLDARVARAPAELKAFAKVRLAAGEATVVSLELGPRAFAHWHARDAAAFARVSRLVEAVPFMPTPSVIDEPSGWRIDPGRYELRIGRSSRDIGHTVVVEVVATG